MADVFTPVLTFGPWVTGIMTPDPPGKPYLTVQSASLAPPSVGNPVTYTSMADYDTKYAALNAGDVLYPHPTNFVPSAPREVAPTRSFALPGATIIFPTNQVLSLKIDGIANMNTEFVSGRFDRDTVNGNEAESGIFASSVFCRNSSGFAIRGALATRSCQTFYVYNNSNFVIENNVAQFSRADFCRLDENPAQFQVRGNYFGDVATNAIMWWYPNGTTPVFQAADPGGGASNYPKEHNDGIQAYHGSMTDADINGNTLYVFGQGTFIADNLGNPQLRVRFTGNTVYAADPHQLMIDNGSNVEVTGNAFIAFPVANPDTTDFKWTLAGSTYKVGNNTLNYLGGSVLTFVGTTQAAFTGAISGAATSPTAPTFTGTTSNIANLPTLRQRPALLPVPNPPIPSMLPILLSDGTNTIGTKVTARPPLWNPFTPGMEDNLYTRFKLDGTIVRASTMGRAAFVYTAAANGNLTVEFSSDNANWSSASAPMTISSGGGGGSAWDPAHKSSEVSLYTANTVATCDQGFNPGAKTVFSATAKNADGKYSIRGIPSVWSASSQGLGFARAGLATNIEIGNAANSWGMYNDGTLQKSGVYAGNVGARTQNPYEYLLEISGGVTVAKLWIYDVSAGVFLNSFGGGDPNGGGGGWDISGFLGAGGIMFGWNGSAGTGESCTIQTTGYTPTSGFTLWG